MPGMMLSGAQLKGLARYNQGFASNEFGNWYNRMRDMTGVGERSAGALNTIGMNTAGNVGAAQQGAGNARASGHMARANIYGSLANKALDLGTTYASGGFGG